MAAKKRLSGFTLLEIMIATVFFAVAFVNLMTAYNTGLFADLYLDRGAIAVNLAQESMEELKRRLYGNITVGTTTEAAVTGFAFFQRVTQVTETAGINQPYKTITVTVSWLMKGAMQNYALTTYIARYEVLT